MPEYKITVLNGDNKTEIAAESGTVLADALSGAGFTVPAACGRRGVCGKCAVRLLGGRFGEAEPDKNGMILSCRAVITGDAEIEVGFSGGKGLTDFGITQKAKAGKCGIAVDIGTTTVAAAFLKKDGTQTFASALNPQSAYGADVISRISACSGGKLPELTELIIKCINGLIKELDPDGKAEELVVSGNTTMLHIFCGVSPESMGVTPFTPQFTGARFFSGKEHGLNISRVTVLPSVSAFIGSDISAGIYALGLHKSKGHSFLADLGTNGELVFSDNGKLFCTSTAAGPALEGAGIECGTGGVNGAVSKVFLRGGQIAYSTIGAEKPNGICGSGLTDAVALLLREELMDETGFIEDSFRICDGVYISQKDIRAFQLAKSAVYSGISVLCDTAGTAISDIDEFYIAGGLGCYMDPESAVTAGILPKTGGKITAAGNTSLAGAVMCIGDPGAVEEMEKLTRSCVTVDLGGNPEFAMKFTENMFFN